jgi:hypothetical protein
MEAILAKHNTALLNMFKQMMVGVFGPGMEKVSETALETALYLASALE